MGDLYEERFSVLSNETAGERFTPREDVSWFSPSDVLTAAVRGEIEAPGAAA